MTDKHKTTTAEKFYLTGTKMLSGDGFKKDPERGLKFLMQAATQGDKETQYKVLSQLTDVTIRISAQLNARPEIEKIHPRSINEEYEMKLTNHMKNGMKQGDISSLEKSQPASSFSKANKASTLTNQQRESLQSTLNTLQSHIDVLINSASQPEAHPA